MEYIINHIPNSAKRPQIDIYPMYLTIHSTGNPSSTATNERGWLTNLANTSSASWHICVDEIQAIEAIPLNEIAYHAGIPQGNNESISIKMCESGDRKVVLNNTIALAADILYERSWNIGRLKRHFDWSGKNCPSILMNESSTSYEWQPWEDFKLAVALKLAEKINKNSEETRYNTTAEVPIWARPTIKKLVEKGFLSSREGGLDLSIDMIRILVINDRALLYD